MSHYDRRVPHKETNLESLVSFIEGIIEQGQDPEVISQIIEAVENQGIELPPRLKRRILAST